MADSNVVSDSILEAVEKYVSGDYVSEAFEAEIILHINACLSILNQIGAGPTAPLMITGNTETWSQFSDDPIEVSLARSYMYSYVRLAFDPPTSSFVLESLKALKAEQEWRLNIHCESKMID